MPSGLWLGTRKAKRSRYSEKMSSVRSSRGDPTKSIGIESKSYRLVSRLKLDVEIKFQSNSMLLLMSLIQRQKLIINPQWSNQQRGKN